MAEEKKNPYVSDIPKAIERADWRKHFNFVKVSSVGELEALRDKFNADGNPELSVDSETNSLSIIDLFLVGFSFCWDLKNAYYVPTGHLVGDNVDQIQALSILDEMMKKARMNLFYNPAYDLRVFRKYGLDAMNYKIFDVMSLVWNVDTNIIMPSLKNSALYHLGFKMTTFKELLSVLATKYFSLTGNSSEDEEEGGNLALFPSTQEVVDYAAADALCTKFLFVRFLQFLKENYFINMMDSEFQRVLMYLEETKVFFDKAKAEKINSEELTKLDAFAEEIYKLAGQRFDIKSNKVLIDVFKRAGIPLSRKTAKGNFTVNEEALEELSKSFPIAKKIIDFRKCAKAANTYLDKFLGEPENWGRFCYLAHRNPTGRLAGSGGNWSPKKGTRYFTEINIQAVTKPKPGFFVPRFTGNQDGILGYEFEEQQKDIPGSTVEGYKPNNIREIILPAPGHLMFSADYSGQEIVVAANISGDRAFLEPLMRGEDIHKDVAIKMFGVENYDKDKRKIAKFANFGCIYLGTEWALKGSLPEKSLEELKIYYELWRKTHREYFDFLESRYREARSCGYVKTALGRHRRVRFWMDSPDWKEVFFGKKTIANSPVQGLGGDIIRLTLIRIFQEILINPKYEGKCFFVSTVHDELNFSIDKDPVIFNEIANKILFLMEDLPFYNPPHSWKVRLKASPSVGRNWGELFPFKQENGVWSPKV